MSSSRTKVPFIAEARDPMVEVFVIDGSFKKIAEGLGRVRLNLPPGLYRVVFKAGNLVEHVDAVVEPGSSLVRVEAPSMTFSSSAPLQQTKHTREYHQDASARLSREIHATTGNGSRVFVFVRDVDRRGRTNPATGLSLHNLAGKLIVDFATAGENLVGHAWDNAWSGCNVELAPGPYRLRVRTGEIGSLEHMPSPSSASVGCRRRTPELWRLPDDRRGE